MTLFFYDTEIGRVAIAGDERFVTNFYFEMDVAPQDAEIGETDAIREGAAQLGRYLAGALRNFTVPLAPQGTDFLKSVWKALCAIPYGTTTTYGAIAASLGRPKAARAVGLANNRNPIPVFIPCHRVVGHDGRLVGFRGGLELKERLLELERRNAVLPLR